MSNKYVATVAEESAQQYEKAMNRITGKKEDFGGGVLYFYVSSAGDIFHDV